MWILLIITLIILITYLVKYINKDYNILALCPRIKTVDGTPLEDKLVVIPGKTIFGNNFDILKLNPETIFNFSRYTNKYSKGKSYLLQFIESSIYSINNAEDAEEIFQSQQLITKSVIYDLVKPFLGDGLLISTDQKWHSRRKMLTPAFHFNILQGFLEIFKEESFKAIETLNNHIKSNGEIIALQDFIPQFTLNNICETALGVKLYDIEGSEEYRKTIHKMEKIIVQRLCNPLMYYRIYFYLFGDYADHKKYLKIAHDFSDKIIERKRKEFQNFTKNFEAERLQESFVDYGRKKRYAMLDTLLDAESQGLIDHQGICDEVNTFMFEGYDTTSTALIMTIFNLALHGDIQEKCYEEIQNLADINVLTVFDFNNLDYLECVIKESLRLYPSVPFIGRACTETSIVNGLILPPKTEINIHIFDIMRDERHFPQPNEFQPERFLPHNTTNRHPFAYVPFSAGARNCIGQKFALLEIKVLLVAIIKQFLILPVTRLEDVVFENGLVLRTQQNIKVKFIKRN